MSHPNQREFISFTKEYFPAFFEQKKVLEVGSLCINRSVREFFTNCDYIGVDLEIGKCVDIAIPGQLVDFPSKSFDVTISCECFEHNPFWLETFINMLRMTKPGGLVMMTCACYGRPEHGTFNASPGASPLTIAQGWNYYCNLSETDFLEKLNLENWFDCYHFYYSHSSKDLYFLGIAKTQQVKKEDLEKLDHIQDKYQGWQNFLYQNMCILLGRKIFQGLRLYWLLDPLRYVSDKWQRTFNNK